MRVWWRRWWWPLGKALLAVTILVMIGIHFQQNLSQLDFSTLTLNPLWLALSGLLYIVALGGSAWFWYHLMRAFGQRPAGWATLRAYYLGHLGKYVPGKAWSILMRGNMVKNKECRVGVAMITSFYEVLTTMASAGMLAAILFALEAPAATTLILNPVVSGVLAVMILGVPLLPAVFNRLVARAARKFQNVESFRLPPLRFTTLAIGLAVTGCGWAIMGLSLWSMVQAVLPEPHALTLADWARYIAINGIAYVAGFAAFMLPSGVGVREVALYRFLGPELAEQMPQGEAVATVVVLMLRVLWTSMELLVGAIVIWFPGRDGNAEKSEAPSADSSLAEAHKADA
jgi:hypothetical protein